MLHWDLGSDVITGGQWLSGRLYNKRCGISPDGELFIYFCGKFKSSPRTFTAICRPPYFTALAFWPDDSTWGGGGFFKSSNRVILNYGFNSKELNDYANIPRGFEVSNMSAHKQQYPHTHAATRSQGWVLVQEGSEGRWNEHDTMRLAYEKPWIFHKQNPVFKTVTLQRQGLGMFERNGPRTIHDYKMVDEQRDARANLYNPVETQLGQLDWADWDDDGSLLFSKDGCLYRQSERDLFGKRDPTITLIADLRAQEFENIPPSPRAQQWPAHLLKGTP